jgi:excinuclease ABC subunit C
MNDKISKLQGDKFIKTILKDIPENSGIYKMFDSNNKILYVGKAKNLKNRITNYSKLEDNSLRIQSMIKLIAKLEWIITLNETDALILEADLIKSLKPKYNILLRDDKTFPYIRIENTCEYPRISKFRTKNIDKENLFGPFASTMAVNEIIDLLQKTFMIRTCSDNVFKNRSKPCVLYQVKRCSAPCVGKISVSDYSLDIKHTINFLKGNENSIKSELIKLMDNASKNFLYEDAILYRNKINMINQIQAKNNVSLPASINLDLIIIVEKNFLILIEVFIFRNGKNNGSINFFIENILGKNIDELIDSTLLQFYSNRNIPEYVCCNKNLKQNNNYFLAAIEKTINKKIKIKSDKDNDLKNIINFAENDAKNKIESKLIALMKWKDKFLKIQNLLKMENKINDIEIYDNSHLYGTNSVGVMVKALESGFVKDKYRIFKIKNLDTKSNDDYAMMKEFIERRLKNLIKDKEKSSPSLIIIDGGLGQLKIACNVYNNIKKNNIDKLDWNTTIIGVAKGENRNAGEETIILETGEKIHLPKDSSDLHFIQHLRNEAHRFAITTQRKSKLKSFTKSEIDSIPQIGIKRKKSLIEYFISIDKIKEASLQELQKVPNINKKTAEIIFNWFRMEKN